MTEPRNVKNFLVVVKMEHARGPKLVIVVKMNIYKSKIFMSCPIQDLFLFWTNMQLQHKWVGVDP
jgi:hypothetical protein